MARPWKARDLAHGQPPTYAELVQSGALDFDASEDEDATTCAGCDNPLRPGDMERSPSRGALVCSGGTCASEADRRGTVKVSDSDTEPVQQVASRMCSCGIMISTADARACVRQSCTRIICSACDPEFGQQCPACNIFDQHDIAIPISDPTLRTCKTCARVSTDEAYIELIGCTVCLVCYDCVKKREVGKQHVCPEQLCYDTMCKGCMYHDGDVTRLESGHVMCPPCIAILKTREVSPLLHNWTHVGATAVQHAAFINRICFYAGYAGAINPDVYDLDVQQRADMGLAPSAPLPPLPTEASPGQRMLTDYVTQTLVLQPPARSLP